MFLIGTRRLRKWVRQDLSEEMVVRQLKPKEQFGAFLAGDFHHKTGNRSCKWNIAYGLVPRYHLLVVSST